MTRASTSTSKSKRARSAKPAATRRPSTGRGRKVGETSPAIAKAARAAGELGGRPPAKLTPERLAEIGDAPTDVLKKDAWWSSTLEKLTQAMIRGEPGAKGMLEAAVRAASIATKSYEREVKALLAELMEKEDREVNEDHAPRPVAREEDPIAKVNRGALRRDPS